MADAGEDGADDDVAADEATAPDPRDLDAALRDLQADFEAFEIEIKERTVDRPRLESELKQYVREQRRRGHAQGWGPYLVLLYGTVMTLGAFYLLSGGWAILAMFVVWLSTLGLYALMVLVGIGLTIFGLPGRTADWVRRRRS